MSLPPPPKIEDVGLEKWLNDSADKHNGLGYDKFVQMISVVKSKSAIAAVFGVERRTIARWIEQYKKEQAA